MNASMPPNRFTCIVLFGLLLAPNTVAAGDTPELRAVPSGSFLMGSPADEPEREGWVAGTESPQHRIEFPRAFEIGRFSVTVRQYAHFIAETGWRSDGGCHVFDGRDWHLRAEASWRAPGFPQTDDHPVVCVGWYDAMAYVSWLDRQRTGHRLPTEAEREYATRAGTATPFWFGAQIGPGDANYDTRGGFAGGVERAPFRGTTVPVDSYAANPWGLYAVHGNVWEWTADCYAGTHANRPVNLLADGSQPRTDTGCDRRSLRGGAFNRHPSTLRSAYRTGLDPGFRGHSIGFRVARTIAIGP